MLLGAAGAAGGPAFWSKHKRRNSIVHQEPAAGFILLIQGPLVVFIEGEKDSHQRSWMGVPRRMRLCCWALEVPLASAPVQVPAS